MRDDGSREHTHGREAADENEQARSQPCDEGVAAGMAAELRVRCPDVVEPSVGSAVQHELGRAPQHFDEVGGQSAALGCRAPAARPCEPLGEQWDENARDQKSESEDESCSRQNQRSGGDRDDADQRGGGWWPCSPQVEALQCVDVAHHPADEVAVAVGLELCRGKRLDPRVEPRSNATERAQGEVVRDEPVEIAGERAREAEEPHEHDRHRQRQNRGLLRSP